MRLGDQFVPKNPVDYYYDYYYYSFDRFSFFVDYH